MADDEKKSSKTWDFTLNNYTEDEVETVTRWSTEVKKMSVSKEVGESGTPHLQARVTFARAYRLPALKKLLPRAHWLPTKAAQDSLYVLKAGSEVIVHVDNRQQGRRNDIHDAAEAVKSGASITQVARDHSVVYVKYHKGLERLARSLEVLPRDEAFVPKPWQQEIIDRVSDEPDDRTIVWVEEPNGNVGKSRLARHLVLEHGGVMLEGKVADMAFIYDKQRLVVFDITRAQAEMSAHIYSFAEKLKNGMLVSTKYEGGMKVFNPPHVIFFSNTTPPYDMWSADRVVHIDLNLRNDATQVGQPIF